MQLSLLRRGGDEESYTDCSAICRAAQVLSQLACSARCEIIHRIISLYARALSSSTLFIFLSQKLKTDSSEPVFNFCGGDEESRTPVRKHFRKNFSERSR